MVKKTLSPAAVGAVSFPFDMEGANFATGALKVNPVCVEMGGKVHYFSHCNKYICKHK